MDPDLYFVIGIILIGFAIPAIISAFSESRAPRSAAILIMVGGGLLALAIYERPGAYSFARIPDIFVKVVGQYVN